MESRFFDGRPLAAIALLTLSAIAAHADVARPHRLSEYDITFSDNTFNDANAHYTITSTVTSPNGQAQDYSVPLGLKALYQNLSITGDGGESVNSYSVSGTTATISNHNDGTTGHDIFSYDTPAATQFTSQGTFGNTWIVRNDYGGNVGLEFQGGGTGLVDNSGEFDLKVLINGDWSSLGTGPGQTEFVGLDSHWTVTDWFGYNSGTNTTEFDAYTNPYNGNNAGLDFILHSSAPFPLPEPGTVAMLTGMALSGAVFLRRKRR